jgi:adenosine deaminase
MAQFAVLTNPAPLLRLSIEGAAIIEDKSRTAEEQKMKKFLVKMNKTEIHLHLEGLISIETVWKLINKNKLHYEGINSKGDIRQKFLIKTLDEFLYVFLNIIQNSIRSAEDVGLLMQDAGEYLKKNNIAYAEIFFAPTKLLEMGLDYKQLIEILTEGAILIKKKYNITVKYIVDVSRTFGVENAMKNLDLAIKHNTSSIIGIGLGGAEEKGPAKDFVRVFDKAKENGLHIVAHAGEDAGPESIWDALTYLKIERIGHGISAMYDEKLMDFLAEKQIPIEICPTSNLFTQKYVKILKEHPVKKFFNKKMKVTINTDDPSLFSTNLINEYSILLAEGVFTKNEIVRLINNTVDSTFLPQEEKNALIKKNLALYDSETCLPPLR